VRVGRSGSTVLSAAAVVRAVLMSNAADRSTRDHTHCHVHVAEVECYCQKHDATTTAMLSRRPNKLACRRTDYRRRNYVLNGWLMCVFERFLTTRKWPRADVGEGEGKSFHRRGGVATIQKVDHLKSLAAYGNDHHTIALLMTKVGSVIENTAYNTRNYKCGLAHMRTASSAAAITQPPHVVKERLISTPKV